MPSESEQAKPVSIFTHWPVLAVFVATLLFITYQLAVLDSDKSSDEVLEENEFLRNELDVLASRLENSEARLAVLEQEAAVIRSANRQLRSEEAERQAEIDQLQAQVDFFGRLSGTSGSQTGLTVFQVELERTASPMVFRFVLSLTQNMQRASIVSGKASLDLEGTLDDRAVTLYWPQLSEGITSDTGFRFKYFQQLEGYITLPEAFSPTRLLVSLDVKGQRNPLVETFDWQQLIDGSVSAVQH